MIKLQVIVVPTDIAKITTPTTVTVRRYEITGGNDDSKQNIFHGRQVCWLIN